eukprot:3317585-Rhodomonas_salina.1
MYSHHSHEECTVTARTGLLRVGGCRAGERGGIPAYLLASPPVRSIDGYVDSEGLPGNVPLRTCVFARGRARRL